MQRDDALRLLREQLHALDVSQLFVYSSVARNEEARQDSDVDLLVEPSNQRFSIFDLARVRDLCRTILGTTADITTMTARADCRNSGVASGAISCVSSDTPHGDAQRRPVEPAVSAARAGIKALEQIAHDSEVSYLANTERQLEFGATVSANFDDGGSNRTYKSTLGWPGGVLLEKSHRNSVARRRVAALRNMPDSRSCGAEVTHDRSARFKQDRS